MNYLDYLLGQQNPQPGDAYAAAATANQPMNSPDPSLGGAGDVSAAQAASATGPQPGDVMADTQAPAPDDDSGPTPVPPPPQDPGDDLNEAEEALENAGRAPASPTAPAMPAAPSAPQPPTTAQQLQAALSRSNTMAGLMMAMKGAERFGAGAARVKPDDNYLNEMAPLVNKPVEDVLAAQRSAGESQLQDAQKLQLDNAKEKADPNSPTSQFYRDTMNQLSQQSGINLKIPKELSATDMEKLYPNIINIVNSKEARDAKIMAMQAAANQKNQKTVQTLSEGLKKDLDPNQARAGNMAKSQAMLNTLDRADALFQQFPDGNIPAVQTNELSGIIAGVVNGGSAQSQHQITSLTPSSMQGDANKIAGWVTNNPQGLQQQKFIKTLMDTSQRERGVAQSQIDLAKIQRIPAWNRLQQLDPDQYAAELQAAHLNPQDFDARGLYVGKNPNILKALGMAQQQSQQGVAPASLTNTNGPVTKDGLTMAQDAGVRNFMKANNITDRATAIQILKQHGKL